MVKLRPFCAEFLVEAMRSYEVYFYTAGTRPYGLQILDILKLELGRLYPAEDRLTQNTM